MVYLNELMSVSDLTTRILDGYVRSNAHPGGELVLFNYTSKTQSNNEWDDVTEQTRGLIVDHFTQEVVARPFRKFFNWDQLPPNVRADLINKPVEVYEKWDGSLGVLYTLHTGESFIATRGSFTSVQADHANKVLRDRYPTFEPIAGLTYLFEIIYPDNRIVVDYKSMDDLVLLAVVNTETGETLPSGSYDWPGPRNPPVGWTSLSDVLAAPQWANQEGYVVRFPHNDMRVKIKFDEYLRLHRILTNVSTTSLWDALRNGTDLDVYLDNVPDEFFNWITEQVRTLAAKYDEIDVAAREDLAHIRRRLVRPEWDKEQRKEFALLANESEYTDLLFSMYDDRPYAQRIWKRIKPQHATPYSDSQDSA